jgi:hypothetical protein
VGTFSNPLFRSSQLLSSCFAAWLKYRPSVERAAFVAETMAQPADPENPEINSNVSRKYSYPAMKRATGQEKENWVVLTSTGITLSNVFGLVAVFRRDDLRER